MSSDQRLYQTEEQKTESDRLVPHNEKESLKKEKEERRRAKREIQMEYCREECGEKKTFKSESLLLNHLKQRHGLDRTVLCSLCPRRFKNKDLLEHHLQIKHKERPRACSFCDYYNDNPLLTLEHVRRQHSIDPVTCQVCGEVKRNKYILKNHRRDFHARSVCTICGLKMKKDNLKQHMVAKHDNKDLTKFNCDVCGKGFAIRDKMKEHRAIHEDLRPFPCRFDGCDFASKSSGNRRKHEIGKHKAEKVKKV